MPTSHARVQVTVDATLENALRRVAPSLSSQSRAGQIRELALRGAERLDQFDHAEYAAAIDQLLDEDLPNLDAIVVQRHAHSA